MASTILLIFNYTMVLYVVTELILLTFQWRTYRKTGHSSLFALAVSSIFGLLYLAALFATRKYWPPGHGPLAIYLVGAGFLTIQSVVGIIGVRSLFRAFEKASSKSSQL